MTPNKETLLKRRFRRAIRKHTVLFLIQVGFAAVTALAWYFIIWKNEIRVEREDAEYFIAGVIFLASAAWVLKGTEVLRVVWDQYRMMVDATKRADETTIIELKDDHIPLLMHFYLSMLAIITTCVMMVLPYAKWYDGAAAVFLVTLVFTFYAAIILELEDPTESGWVRSQLLKFKPELLTRDSEEYFAEKWGKPDMRVRTKITGHTRIKYRGGYQPEPGDECPPLPHTGSGVRTREGD